MGCCEPNKEFQFGKATEIQTKRDYEIKQKMQHLNNNNSNNSNNDKAHFDSMQSYPNIDYDEEIPQTKEVKVPSAKIPLSIIQNKKQLQLTIAESKYLSEGKVFHINPGGLVGSERNAQDGFTIFGTRNFTYKNDFNFPEEEANIGQRHFEIKYDIVNDEYRIRNLSGSGLYIRLSNKTPLGNNSIFSFSSSIISVTIANDINNNTGDTINSIIKLQVLYGVNQGLERVFESKSKQKIILGRDKTSMVDIDFCDENISRLQATIMYEENKWFIIDGNGKEKSSNGTWYLAGEYITIKYGMVFKAGSTLFISYLFTPKNNNKTKA